jgi:hypothetical protein
MSADLAQLPIDPNPEANIRHRCSTVVRLRDVQRSADTGAGTVYDVRRLDPGGSLSIIAGSRLGRCSGP